jgi:aminoacylase
LLFVPDEETGGVEGMGVFVASDRFRRLNVGFAIDEGLCSPTDVIPVFFGERAVWWIRLMARGLTGHASTFIGADNAMKRMNRCLHEIYDFRQKEIDKLANDNYGGIPKFAFFSAFFHMKRLKLAIFGAFC